MEPQHVSGATILIVDDTPSNLSVLFEYLNNSGFKVLVAEDGETALNQIQHIQPDLILLDVRMPGIDGYETCRRLKEIDTSRDIPVIFLTSLTSTQDKVKGFQVGGVDYITKPLQHEEVIARVQAHLTIRHLQQSLKQQNLLLQQEINAHQRSQATVEYLNKELISKQTVNPMIGDSPVMRQLLDKVERVAQTDSTVLIEGETGTGKEHLAHLIHHKSQRKNRPLVIIDCAALSNDSAERELFGVEKTRLQHGTIKKTGRFDLAHGGTVFLEEVSKLPLSAQSKLLQILQDHSFEQVGGTLTHQLEVRIIAATKKNLQELVNNGTFKEDLYYRLSPFPLAIPPLREHKEDIPNLLEHFFYKNRVKLGNRVNTIDEATLNRLKDYHWPGNILELENIIERALILSTGPTLEIDDSAFNIDSPAPTTSEDTERDRILAALEQSNWIVEGPNGAARLLAIDPDSLRFRIKKIGINMSGDTTSTPQEKLHALSQQEFAIAVKDTLLHYIETDHLQTNPLLNCLLIDSKIGCEATLAQRVDTLRTLFEETAALFAEHPKTEIFSRILRRTYFQPARSQELAAEALGLSYSTFRRRLVKSRSLLTAELWQMEQQSRDNFQ